MPWDEDGTDYDEPKSGGDSHEDEFDEEYGEQQPKGDAEQADADELAAAYGADIEYWENQGADNRQQDPPAGNESSPFAKELGDFEDFSFDWAARSVAGALEDAERVASVAGLSSPGRDDFDWAESVSPVGPPAPDPASTEPPTVFDPAVPFSEARDDTSVSFPFPQRSPDRSETRGADESQAVEHGPASVFSDGFVSEPEPTTIGMDYSQMDIPAGDSAELPEPIYAPATDYEPMDTSLTIGMDYSHPDLIPDDSVGTPEPIYAPETEYEPGMDTSVQVDSTEYLG